MTSHERLQANAYAYELTVGTTRYGYTESTLTCMAKTGRPLTRPDLGRMRPRNISIDDTTWDTTLELAEREGVTAAEVVRRALRAYAPDNAK